MATVEMRSLTLKEREKLGRNLKRLRQERMYKGRPLSQVAFAEVIGRNQATVSGIEAGRVAPTQEFVNKFAELLSSVPVKAGGTEKVSPDDILKGTGITLDQLKEATSRRGPRPRMSGRRARGANLQVVNGGGSEVSPPNNDTDTQRDMPEVMPEQESDIKIQVRDGRLIVMTPEYQLVADSWHLATVNAPR